MPRSEFRVLRPRLVARALCSTVMLAAAIVMTACGGSSCPAGQTTCAKISPTPTSPGTLSDALTGVVIGPSNVALAVNQSTQLTTAPQTAGGAVSVSYSYTSSTPAVATVSGTGQVLGVSPGIATVTVTATGSGTGFATSTRTASTTITVTAPTPTTPAISGLQLASVTDTVGPGQTLQIAPRVQAAGGSVAVLFTYATSAASVATVSSSGLVTAVAPGSALITVTTVGSGTGFVTTTLTAVATVVVRSGLITTLNAPTYACSVGAPCAFTAVTASGGVNPLIFQISPALPPGLSVAVRTGAISGVATATSTLTTYTMTVSDTAFARSTKSFSFSVSAGLVVTLDRPTVSSTVGVPFSTAFRDGLRPVTGVGGTGALTYTITPALPSGLSYASATGALTGTPTAVSGPTVYTVTVTDQAAASATRPFTLTINGALVASPLSATRSCTQAAACDYTPVQASGGTEPYRYAMSPALPAGLALNASSGAVTGTPTATSPTTTYTVTVTDTAGATASQPVALTVNPPLTTTLNAPTYACSVGAACAFTAVTAAGGSSPLYFSITPSLPAGLALAERTGAVSGVATGTSATATYTMTVSDTAGARSSKLFSFSVSGPLTLAVATPSVASTANVSFATAFPGGLRPVTGSGGTGTLTYTVSPALPTGLSMASTTGAISGTPTAASGPTVYTVTVADQAAASGTRQFSMTINPPLVANISVALPSICSVGNSCSISTPGSTGGTAPLTYTVSPTLPAGLSLNAATGAITGVPTSRSVSRSYLVTIRDAVGAAVSGTVAFGVSTPGAFLSMVSAGGYHVCGLNASGAAYCWGANDLGQVGDGTTTNRSKPVAVSGGRTFSSITAGASHSCGLVGQSVACWGQNLYGQLGDNTTTNHSTPTAVSNGAVSFTAVSAGQHHTCALSTTGAAYCWGDNAYGQVGNGTVGGTRLLPTAVTGGLTFTAINAGGGDHTCARTSAGVVYCWGRNTEGQLGDNTTTSRGTPVAVSTAQTFASVIGGLTHTCALTAAGATYCWGDNLHGALGDGSTTRRFAPTAASGVGTLSILSAGGYAGCGVNSVGAAICWGWGTSGQHGDGLTNVDQPTASAVLGGLAFSAITSGFAHTCGLSDFGEAYCWGYNFYGQVGDLSATNRTVPTRVGAP